VRSKGDKTRATLRQRYAAAHATGDRAAQVAELRACASQGHVQANMDLGRLFDAECNPECVDFFGEAHNFGHPGSLLELSKTFLNADDAGQAVRVLLLGAWCGSFICVQALLGDAAAVKSFRGGHKGKVPLVAGGKQFHARSLSDIERLIDRELSAIRSKELGPKFLAEAAKLPGDSSETTRAAFAALLQEFNPATERMTRRFDKHVGDWLAEGANESVDEAKLARMAALAINDEDESKEGGHD